MLQFAQFVFIVCCFALSLLYGNSVLSRKDAVLLRTGLFVTVLADLCLILLGRYVSGVLLFCFAQMIYQIRYAGLKRLMMFGVSMAAAFTAARFIFRADVLIAVSAAYAAGFCMNLAAVFRNFFTKKNPRLNGVFMLAGMVLFALCDVNVALMNLRLSALAAYQDIFPVLIWVFYIPSQILLALSGKSF